MNLQVTSQARLVLIYDPEKMSKPITYPTLLRTRDDGIGARCPDHYTTTGCSCTENERSSDPSLGVRLKVDLRGGGLILIFIIYLKNKHYKINKNSTYEIGG